MLTVIIRHSSQKIIDSRETGRGLIGELTEIGKIVKGMAPIAMENSALLLLNIALGGARQRLECLRLDYIIAVLSGLAGLAQPCLPGVLSTRQAVINLQIDPAKHWWTSYHPLIPTTVPSVLLRELVISCTVVYVSFCHSLIIVYGGQY
jgi:hypothetical protein